MNVKRLTAAAAAALFASCTSAQITSVKLAGTSAMQRNLISALNVMCVSAGGLMNVYESSTSIKTYVCTGGAHFIDDIHTVRHNAGSGSVSAMLSVTPGYKLPFATTTCSVVAAGSDPHTPPISGLRHTGCILGTPEVADGGVMDVDPLAFAESQLATLLSVDPFDPATWPFEVFDLGLTQVFGVAVSDSLYLKLYRQQRAWTGQNKVIDTTCPAPTDTDANIRAAYAQPECQPTVSRADMGAIMNSHAFNRFKTAGIGGFGLPPGKLVFARMAETGEASTVGRIYFLDAGKPGADSAGGSGAVGAFFEATNTPAHSNVFALLNCGAGCDRIGLLTGGYVPFDVFSGWRYLRLSEVSAGDGYSPATNTASAIVGRYDLAFDAWGVGVRDGSGNYGDAVRALLMAFAQTSVPTPGLYRNPVSPSPESRYYRGSNGLAPFARR